MGGKPCVIYDASLSWKAPWAWSKPVGEKALSASMNFSVRLRTRGMWGRSAIARNRFGPASGPGFVPKHPMGHGRR